MITFQEVVNKFKNRKDTSTSFLSLEEAEFIIKNLTETSKKYILFKKREMLEENNGKKISNYKAWRDSLLGEVCGIELNDPQIRSCHKMCPAGEVGKR
jgi:hypothetical protein